MKWFQKPDWQLPSGVPRGTWEYAHSEQVTEGYDGSLGEDGQLPFDLTVLERCFREKGLIVDLGCGTGRLLLPFAKRGYSCIAVDLSARMLEIVDRKARQHSVTVDRVQANLVELDCLRDSIADYAMCMFSTLGMIRGRDHRRRALEHAARILKPAGTLVVHVHNRWSNLHMPQGRAWVLRNLAASWLKREEAGDKFFSYQDVPQMYLHLYTRSELIADLHAAGLQVVELIAVDITRRGPLRLPWLLAPLRAGGWIAVCRKQYHD